jgi:hypothetical protein
MVRNAADRARRRREDDALAMIVAIASLLIAVILWAS